MYLLSTSSVLISSCTSTNLEVKLLFFSVFLWLPESDQGLAWAENPLSRPFSPHSLYFIVFVARFCILPGRTIFRFNFPWDLCFSSLIVECSSLSLWLYRIPWWKLIITLRGYSADPILAFPCFYLVVWCLLNMLRQIACIVSFELSTWCLRALPTRFRISDNSPSESVYQQLNNSNKWCWVSLFWK